MKRKINIITFAAGIFAMIATSDAEGVLAGATIGNSILGVSTTTSAIAGSITCGIISSQQGFENDALCIIVDTGAIKKEIT